jgi:hypothetical protein
MAGSWRSGDVISTRHLAEAVYFHGARMSRLSAEPFFRFAARFTFSSFLFLRVILIAILGALDGVCVSADDPIGPPHQGPLSIDHHPKCMLASVIRVHMHPWQRYIALQWLEVM